MQEQVERRRQMQCAIEMETPNSLYAAMQYASSEGFHYIVSDLIHPYHVRDLRGGDPPRIIARTDRLLGTSDWSKRIAVRLSKVFQVDSEIEHVREHDKALLKQELGFANHLTLSAIILRISQRDNKNLANILYNRCQSGTTYQIWINIPMTNPRLVSPLTKDQDAESLWEWWNDLRRYANFNRKLGLVLDMPHVDHVPSEAEIERWLGEPVKALLIPTSAFIPNRHNHPVLPLSYQQIIKRFMTLNVQYIIKGPKFNYSHQQYCNYMTYLGKKLYTNTVIEEFSHGCEDVLQNPLQPLSENLETCVYETFERDSIKYVEYQKAVKRALEEMPAEKERIVVMVVGAGRGPLVQAVINASYLTQRNVKVYAVEKNPYAVNTLEERIKNEWKGAVTLIHQDMRVCKPPENADILVSELLGSFGDNELSPECLDGAQRFLNPDGISIPQSYTSYLAPIQNIKLYNEIMSSKLVDKSAETLFETPYVVHLVNVYQIAQSQPLFTFHHPNWSDIINNERMKTLKFKASQNCVLTGFAGFFETVLYKDVMLSTNPQTYSTNMVSWFPIFFPISEPVQIKDGDTVEVTFWREENEERVWYEWCLNSPVRGSIYNPTGRSYFIKKF